MNTVDILNEISVTIDKLYDLVVEDEFLSSDFEKFLTINELEANTQADFNIIITNYIFDSKTQDGRFVLDYCAEKIGKNEIMQAIKNNYRGVFEIKKVLKTGYEVYSLTNEIELTLVSLIKTQNLRSIGRYDFIEARIIELEGEFYLLEIFDCIGSNYPFDAYKKAIKMLVRKPYIMCYKNEKKAEAIKNYIKEVHEKFLKYFKSNEIITSNKMADSLISAFDNQKDGFENFVEKCECDKYFDLDEYKDEDFLFYASKGFNAQGETYDIGLYIDKDFGFFTIPFLGTFNKIFEGCDVENSDKCVLDFLFDENIPPYIIQKEPNALTVINKVLKKINIEEFSSLNDLLKYFKASYYSGMNFSPSCALYNSKVFSQYAGFEKDMV